MFDYYYSEDVERGQRFALGMVGSEIIKPLTEDIFPFDTIPSDAKLVDVGGGRGQVSVRIAGKKPHMTFVVQDEEAILEAGQAEGVPADVRDRIEWMPHDFFKEQPVKGADVYLFRFILHDHSDGSVLTTSLGQRADTLTQYVCVHSNCVKILSRIIDAMDPVKSRILIDDAIVPDALGQDSLRYFNLLDMYVVSLGTLRLLWVADHVQLHDDDSQRKGA